ncbi:MAG: NUDIX domain-containing protein [Humidesulfovibrio sp.]|uniref:NUDIX domain-containing protein n=1 Tax=Humidesulfovibrio sp. TaxID=2910988 RepID=UPI0027374BDF|nr:NUDIX domain-containing protein [Humidesulfovibrio sp.]MDP2847919.1 NUDIX domain-containing protein [Humidesulfovibrio sp.]
MATIDKMTAPTSAPLVEVLDAARRVVAMLPATDVARQKLCHRTVAVLLFDEMGRLALRRRAASVSGRPSRWDVPVRGPVLAGEAVQDAATRSLKAELGIHAERLRPILELRPQPENNNEFLHVFSLTRPESVAPGGQDREAGEYSFSAEELDCLMRDFRELVSTQFLVLAEAMSLKGLWRRRP